MWVMCSILNIRENLLSVIMIIMTMEIISSSSTPNPNRTKILGMMCMIIKTITIIGPMVSNIRNRTRTTESIVLA